MRGRDQRDPHGYLQAASKHLDAANGDSRLEALVDLLVDIWSRNPDEAVLVVAEDNPTVDYLERLIPQFLPEIGARGVRRPLSIAVKRNRDAAATADLVNLFSEYDEDLGRFANGEDQLLIAADIAQVGLNLQHARKLIFFSNPWSPAAVEQWIGRLDRLGSSALNDLPGERTIDIYLIYQRGQVDERVVSVLDSFAVFRRSIQLDSDEINVVTKNIIDAALAPDTVNWTHLSQQAHTLSNDGSDSFITPLSASLPWYPEQARALADRFDQAGSLNPVLEPTRAKRAIVRIESGLRSWMRLMGRSNELRLWGMTAPDGSGLHFRLLHYYRSPFSHGPIEPRFALPGIEPSWGQRYAYLDDRRALKSPPVSTVNIDNNPHTQLHFLDHGNAVHDALVTEWSRIGKAAPICLSVQLPTGHPLATDAYSGTYLVAILTWIPGNLYFDELDRSVPLTGLRKSTTAVEKKPFLDAIQQMEDELRADRRWLNGLLTSRFDVIGARLHAGQWSLLDTSAAEALCMPWNPLSRGKEQQLARAKPILEAAELKAARDTGIRMLLKELDARHQRSLAECDDLRARIASRRYLTAAEADSVVALRQALFDDAAAQGLETGEQGFARSQFRTIRNARDMAKLARSCRLERFDALFESLQQTRYTRFKLVELTVGFAS